MGAVPAQGIGAVSQPPEERRFFSMRVDHTYMVGLLVAFGVWNVNQSGEVRSLREAAGHRDQLLSQRNREVDSLERRMAAVERGCR